MSGLLPSESESEYESESATAEGEDGDLRVLWLDDEEADALIGSLSSETARSVLSTVHEGPRTASEIADAVDTSLQNARHHLTNLQDAGLVRVVDTRFSVKGREMNVYGPVDDSLVVCVGREEERPSFLDSLRRLIGTVGGLALVSLVVQWAFGAGVVDLGGPGTAPRVGDSLGEVAGPVLGLLPPGLAFFAGGLLVVAIVALWEHTRDLTRPDES